jgi:hypothetical protein
MSVLGFVSPFIWDDNTKTNTSIHDLLHVYPTKNRISLDMSINIVISLWSHLDNAYWGIMLVHCALMELITTMHWSIQDQSSCEDAQLIPIYPGEYTKATLSLINKCLGFLPDTLQSRARASSFLDFPCGKFQTEFGKTYCDSCSIGCYCDAVKKYDGGFTPCHPVTYNDRIGQSKDGMCQLCSSGTFSTISGGIGIDVCCECPPGTYNNDAPGKFCF